MGATTGGTTLTVTGAGLNNSMTLSFGGAIATAIACSNSTSCWAFAPAHAAAPPVHLAVTVNNVTSAPSSVEFTYEGFPSVTAISPPSGAVGTALKITGTGFSTKTGTTYFSFLGIAVAGSCSSAINCTAAVPEVPGVVTGTTGVYVTVNGNTSQDAVDFSFYAKTKIPPCAPNCMLAPLSCPPR